MTRYVRQVSVPSVGQEGQSRIGQGEVRVFGAGLDAQICALYLAGAGVGKLSLHHELIERVRTINSGIQLTGFDAGSDFRAELGERRIGSDKPSVLGRGSQVARDVLAGLLRGNKA